MIDADSVDPMSDDELPGAPSDEEPIPLAQKVEIPPFPVKELPKPIADMVHAVAEATQTDPAMAGTSALSALSACTGGHAEIEIRRGWREILVIQTATIALPGERKSAVQMMMVRPIHDVEAQLIDEGIVARAEAESRKQVAKAAAKRATRFAAEADDDSHDEALKKAIEADAIADAIDVPPIPRILADDITPEATASLLAEQKGRLAIISAEGGIFDIIAGRYSGSVPNMDVYLKGHCGDPLRIDRKSHAPEYVRRPALTLGLMIQPEVLNTIAANRQFRGRGFLARILYAYPASKVGRRQIATEPVDFGIAGRYENTVTKLASGMAGWLGDPAVLVLSPAAHEAMIAIETTLEPTLAGDGELAPLADWGAKYAGAIARIAGMIHLAALGPEEGPKTPVQAQTILAAARIGAYFKACAINAFVEMGADEGTADGVYLLERIERLGQDEVSERDMQRVAKRFQARADLLPALNRLIEHGYLTPLSAPKSTGGRPASPRYKVTKGTEGTEGRA
jgi:replicative DNA helicase